MLAQADAISKSQAVIEFNMDGTIVAANQNFLDAMDYTLPEIVGKHHRIFMPREMRHGADYRAFWADLNLGKYKSGNPSGSARAAAMSGSRRPTIRSWM